MAIGMQGTAAGGATRGPLVRRSTTAASVELHGGSGRLAFQKAALGLVGAHLGGPEELAAGISWAA
ncbi:MAG TPA: hypothetical protein VJ938_04360, partial [Acidimicrobiia bacterium]|nr:hypothetical protein [Acidimicrobiia bacterium]